LLSQAGNYCTGIQGIGIAYFQWVYLDPLSKKQTQYHLQIDNNSDFSSPEVDRTIYYTNAFSGALQQQLVLVKQTSTYPSCDYIKYNTDYYWRIKVKNVEGLESYWIYNGATTIQPGVVYEYEYAHPAPFPAYSFSPSIPYPTQEVIFLDSSICYTEAGILAGGCQSLDNADCVGGYCYTWNFGDAGYNSDPTSNPPIVYTIGSTSHIYTQAQEYDSSLKVCDDIGCCISGKDLDIQTSGSGNTPKWKEVSPF